MEQYEREKVLNLEYSQTDVHYSHNIPLADISGMRKEYLCKLTIPELEEWIWYLSEVTRMSAHLISTRLDCSKEFVQEKLIELSTKELSEDKKAYSQAIEGRPKWVTCDITVPPIPEIVDVSNREPRYLCSMENTIEYLNTTIEELLNKLMTGDNIGEGI